MKHLYLVDGSGFIFRAFYALPPMTSPDGMPVNAVYGFTNMLLKLVKEIEDRESDLCGISIIFDSSRKTFRNDIYPKYKANRSDPPPDLVPQFSLIREATKAFGLPSIELLGYEADDLIATFAKTAANQNIKVTILSSDKDLMQLVDKNVLMRDPMKNHVIDETAVFNKFGVGPKNVIDVQALAGDSSDNIPGAPGIGIKTAAELINNFGSLDGLLKNADTIKQPKRREAIVQNVEEIKISRELVTLKNDVPIKDKIADFSFSGIDIPKLKSFLERYAFNKIIQKIESESSVSVNNVADSKHESEKGRSNEEPRYDLITKSSELDEWIRKIESLGVVAVDTETTSLNPLKADLVGISLSIKPGVACYIPLGHKRSKETENLDFKTSDHVVDNKSKDFVQIPMTQAIKMLKPVLENPAILKIGQNIKYDILVLSKYGINVRSIDDTMLLSYVLEAGLHGHGMDELAKLFLDRDTIKYKDIVGSGKSQITFDLVNLSQALEYAAEDADVTYQLHQTLKKQLTKDRMIGFYEAIERPLIQVLANMERSGVKVDVNQLKKLSAEFQVKLEKLEKEIFQLSGMEFNIASPKQLSEVLFGKLGLPGKKKRKTGAYSTEAEILEELASAGNLIVEKILDWRQLAKLKNTYTDSLIEQANKKTGRVHTSFLMSSTATGRLASSDPNLQNVPIRTSEGRKIRRAFVASKGYKLISLDYSQIELRILSHVANVKALQDAFISGADIHSQTASEIFGVSLNDVDSEMRRKAKTINFGIIYGISPFGLANQLRIDHKEATQYIDNYFKKYPEIKKYMEATKSDCRKHGFVKTIFGRKCFVVGINDKNPARRKFSERAAINAPIQGSAADIIKRAMIKINKDLAESNFKSKMLLQVHDELVFETPVNEVKEISKFLKNIMECCNRPALELKIPLVVDIGYGDNWDEAH
jgi:DNA polymerase-1